MNTHYGLEKIASESIFDKDVGSDLRKINKKGKIAQMIGTSIGVGASATAISAASKGNISNRKRYILSLLAAAAPIIGAGIGAKMQTKIRDRAVRRMPEGSKFKRLYQANNGGASDTEMKEFDSAYNTHVRHGKSLSSKHVRMRKSLIGY